MISKNLPHFIPTLTRVQHGDVFVNSDESLLRDYGITIAFSERTGGVSSPPYESLNLGLHVMDDRDLVLQNRTILMDSLKVSQVAQNRLATAEQTHGTSVAFIDEQDISSPRMFADVDCLVTTAADSPILLCYADCVPVILVSLEPRVVAVVHSGWKGTLGDIAGKTVSAMAERYELDPAQLYAYIGPAISKKNFETSPEIASQFVAKFVTLSTVYDAVPMPDSSVPLTGNVQSNHAMHEPVMTCHVDLSSAIRESLGALGVKPCHIASLDVCTVETTDRLFSYRAECGITGRHGAFAMLADV